MFVKKMKPLVEQIECRDGFKVSIQASSTHYCSPREDYPANGYSSFELGYPSEEEPLIFEYAEGDDYTNTVYGWVPREVVFEMLNKHGGVVNMTVGQKEMLNI